MLTSFRNWGVFQPLINEVGVNTLVLRDILTINLGLSLEMIITSLGVIED